MATVDENCGIGVYAGLGVARISRSVLEAGRTARVIMGLETHATCP